MKRAFSFLLAFLIFMQIFSFAAFSVNDSSSPKHIPRVVSVVFDDSGSMYNKTDRWAYTSYAMQSFVAMMSSEDILYVTYLNAATDPVQIDLSDGGKQSTIDKIEKTVFGGGTDNKLEKAASRLKAEHAKLGTNAKYYFVVMADGELDKGEMSVELKKQVTSLNQTFTDADLEIIYFSMKKNDTLSLSGVTSHTASSGNEIVSVLREISADIMGRTTLDFNVSGGKVSFSLPYPALNVAVFVQKENKAFSNVSVPITKDGKAASYQVRTYYVDCPTQIVKNENHTKYTEVVPSSPPSGFVSLIKNGNSSLPKGSYTLDLSSYGVSKNNVIVLVEPAVRIGCQYFRGDSTTPISFTELRSSVRNGDTIRVKCGLYEINSDGSLGAPVPLSVLSPKYSLYVNNKPVGSDLGNNEYQLVIDKESFENQDLKVEAVLKGYQPFVIRENFGEINVKPAISPDSNHIAHSTENLTKPTWSTWTDGTKTFEFVLNDSAASLLKDLSIKVDNANFLTSGKCTNLKNITTSGNRLIYTVPPVKNTEFSKLPQNFKISLCDNISGEAIASATIKVIQPEYKIESINEIGTTPLSLNSLKNNTKALKFTLLADYNGSGSFEAVNQNCESDIKLTIESGVLTGKTTEGTTEISFVPVYDAVTNTDVSPTEIFGKDHSIVATATIDGKTVKSEPVLLSIGNASYKVVVDNPIQEAFTLDSIKTNKQKITFSLQADYTGDGVFGAIEEWDYAIYDKLTVNAGELPGVIKTEYDSANNPIGKSFTPLYDENNNNGVVFTKVAGKTHKITGLLEAYNASAETTAEVLAPVYEIQVRKNNVKIIDTKLHKNTEGLEFLVLRNGRALNAEELENLESYAISLNPEQKWMTIETSVRTTDGTSYLFCKPTYDGWKFISPKLYAWMCLFMLDHSDTTLTIQSGENSANATIEIALNGAALIILLIVLGILLFISFVSLCFATRIRFEKGYFFVVDFEKSGLDYIASSISIENSRRNGIVNFFKQFAANFGLKALKGFRFKGPFYSEQTKNIAVDGAFVKLTTQRDPVNYRKNPVSYPYVMSKEVNEDFGTGTLKEKTVRSIVKQKDDIKVGTLSASGISDSDEKLSFGTYVKKNGSMSIILFVTKEEYKNIINEP